MLKKIFVFITVSPTNVLVFPITGRNDKLVWLGGRDVPVEGTWKWECDGSLIGNPFIFQQDNYDEAPAVNNADCLAWAWKPTPSSMWYYWGDENCSERKYPLCKCNTCECGGGKLIANLFGFIYKF